MPQVRHTKDQHSIQTLAAHGADQAFHIAIASGQGFCWNFARSVTAVGPLVGGLLVGTFGSFPAAAASTAAFYVIGLVAIWFGPETRNVPLAD